MRDGSYTMTNYQRRDTFSSFLPGLSGRYGIPIWCYYVNRGQCIASFGVEDKDHAIMEFSPAHQAYENVDRLGFRSFVRINGDYIELFSQENTEKNMKIGKNTLSIHESIPEQKLSCSINYFTLPGEKIGALVRKVVIRNHALVERKFEVLDGMPALIPYGISMGSIKEMGNTSMAWMQCEDLDTKVPFYRVRASMVDSAVVTMIEGGNFSFAGDEEGNHLQPFVDPKLVFGYDTGLKVAVNFREKGLEGMRKEKQVTSNQYPCSFFGIERTLQPEECLTIFELVGQVSNKELLKRYVSKKRDATYFETKEKEAIQIANELCSVIQCKTASKEFDAYADYTYMDNVLRGGFPVKLPGDKIFYLYSRKHGDLERDYNYYRMLPEFYSQGNGNYRDVNQNRRCDVLFTPYVKSENIEKFYQLIQLDGYNPLAVEKVTYTLSSNDTKEIFYNCSSEQIETLALSLEKPFTPGEFFLILDQVGVEDLKQSEDYFNLVIKKAENRIDAEFGEGYWSDHWTYNLDLVESFLNIYPEQEEELLFDSKIAYFRSQIPILPRKKRYEITKNGVRQYHFLDNKKRLKQNEKLVRDKKDEIVVSCLMEKLILLCTTKFAALDSYGMGIEMEGGKPGWYDALNGMPGLFGSSMAETYELARLLEFTISKLQAYDKTIAMVEETALLLEQMSQLVANHQKQIETSMELIEFWNERNDAKESYWETTFHGISGERVKVSSHELICKLVLLRDCVDYGIRKACKIGGRICPTYFTYELDQYKEEEDGIVALHFNVQIIPFFLEGPVHYLKLPISIERKKELYDEIRKSDLYDSKLQMYKVNASLKDASFELGRAKAFTAGWLENESIWLHMEYKYLLELIKSGLYQQFKEDFHKAAVPFLDPEVYKRSIYENSSFIVSSKNPDPSLHGISGPRSGPFSFAPYTCRHAALSHQTLPGMRRLRLLPPAR